MKTPGRLLLIFGIGIPVISALVTVITFSLNPHEGLIGLLFLVTTYPVIFIPLWVLPIIGGVFALKGKHNTFVLFSSCVSLVYWIPFIFLAVTAFHDRAINYLAYLLYLPLLVLATIAFAGILKSGKERG